MKARSVSVFTALTTLAAPTAVAASALSLGMEENSTVKRIGARNGGPIYGQQGLTFSQTFVVQVLDDAGAPVSGCLGTDAAVEVVTAKGVVVGPGPAPGRAAPSGSSRGSVSSSRPGSARASRRRKYADRRWSRVAPGPTRSS